MKNLSLLKKISLFATTVVIVLLFQNCGKIQVTGTGLNSGDGGDIAPVESLEIDLIQTFPEASFTKMESTEDGSLMLITRGAGTNQIAYGLSLDRGESFTLRTTAQNNFVSPHEIFVRNNKVFISANLGLYVSTNNGQSFQNLGANGYYSIAVFYVSPVEDIYVSSWDKVLKYAQGSTTATELSLPELETNSSYYGFHILEESQNSFTAITSTTEISGISRHFKITGTGSEISIEPALMRAAPPGSFIIDGLIRLQDRFIYGANGSNALWTNNLSLSNPTQLINNFGITGDILLDADNIIYAETLRVLKVSLDGSNFTTLLESQQGCDYIQVEDMHESKWGDVYVVSQCVVNNQLSGSSLYKVRKIRQSL